MYGENTERSEPSIGRPSLKNRFGPPTLNVMLVDHCGRIIRINNNLSKLLGKTSDRLIGQKFGNAFNCMNSHAIGGCGNGRNCYRCKIRNAIEDVLKNEREVRDVEINKTLMIGDTPEKFRFLLNAGLVDFNEMPHVLIILSQMPDKIKSGGQN
jgi:hypothetical protein